MRSRSALIASRAACAGSVESVVFAAGLALAAAAVGCGAGAVCATGGICSPSGLGLSPSAAAVPAGIAAVGTEPEALQLLEPRNRAAGDLSGIRTLRRHLQRPPCLTPLGADEAGLVVFSQDPRVARKLLEDAATLEHEFVVEVAGVVDPALLPRWAGGLAGVVAP